MPYLFWKYGATIRSWTKYSSEAAAFMEMRSTSLVQKPEDTVEAQPAQGFVVEDADVDEIETAKGFVVENVGISVVETIEKF
jgi:hypothetical protein